MSDIPSIDGPQGWFVPETSAHFTAIGLAAPDFLWPCQDASGALANVIGSSVTLTAGNSPMYRQTVTGWRRWFVGSPGLLNSEGFYRDSALLKPAAGESYAMLALASFTVPPAGGIRALIGFGDSPGSYTYAAQSGGLGRISSVHNGVGANGIPFASSLSLVKQICWFRNATADVSGTVTDTESIAGTHSEAAINSAVGLGGAPRGSADKLEARWGWFAIYKGANAERDWAAFLSVLRSASTRHRTSRSVARGRPRSIARDT